VLAVFSVCGLYRACPLPDPPVHSRPPFKPPCGICCFTTTTFGAHRGADSGAGWSSSGRDRLHQPLRCLSRRRRSSSATAPPSRVSAAAASPSPTLRRQNPGGSGATMTVLRRPAICLADGVCVFVGSPLLHATAAASQWVRPLRRRRRLVLTVKLVCARPAASWPVRSVRLLWSASAACPAARPCLDLSLSVRACARLVGFSQKLRPRVQRRFRVRARASPCLGQRLCGRRSSSLRRASAPRVRV
jgi:hypothetical protein